jgi:hypothetical protein
MTNTNSVRPPAAVAAVARRALELRRKHGRGGTLIGVRRAVQLAHRQPVSRETLRRMASFFARHGPDDRSDPTSAASIAWGLWGGYEGRAWVRSLT